MSFHLCHYTDGWCRINLRYITALFIMVNKPLLPVWMKSVFLKELIGNIRISSRYYTVLIIWKQKKSYSCHAYKHPVLPVCFVFPHVCCHYVFLPPRQITVRLCYTVHWVIWGCDYKGTIHSFIYLFISVWARCRRETCHSATTDSHSHDVKSEGERGEFKHLSFGVHF